MFAQDGEVDNFRNSITTLGDGCVANIATQFSVSLYKSLIEDPSGQILFSVFYEKIANPVLNLGDRDNLNASSKGSDIMDSSLIQRQFILPTVFFKALEEEFFKDSKKAKDPWPVILSNLGADNTDEILETMLKKGLTVQEVNQMAAKIAAYVIIQKISPEMCLVESLRPVRLQINSIVGLDEATLLFKFDNQTLTKKNLSQEEEKDDFEHPGNIVEIRHC